MCYSGCVYENHDGTCCCVGGPLPCSEWEERCEHCVWQDEHQATGDHCASCSWGCNFLAISDVDCDKCSHMVYSDGYDVEACQGCGEHYKNYEEA